jgi:predicted N-acetyltransferase YhbS
MRETETEVVIRPAQERDIEVLARLRCDAFFERTDRTLEDDADGLRQLLLDARFEIALVAELDGVVVGSALFVQHELEPAHDVTPWLAGLVVAPGHRRRGIGQKLVRAIEDHARSLGTPELYLYSWDARTFYLKLNWQAVEAFQQDGEPMMLMRKRLGGYGPLETPAT